MSNPLGGATQDNMPAINNGGVPDVVICDKNNNPVYQKGYTTVQSYWPNTLAYHATYPEKASDARDKKRQSKCII